MGGGLWRPTGGRRSETGLLLLDGGDRFRGCVVQVLRCCDGQAALRQDPLGLVHIGSWQEKKTVTAARPGGAKGSAEMGEKWPAKLVFSDARRGQGANDPQPTTALERRRESVSRASPTATLAEEGRAKQRPALPGQLKLTWWRPEGHHMT